MELQGVEEYRQIRDREGHEHHPRIRTFSSYVSIKAKSLMGHLFRANTNDPMRKATLLHQHTENFPNPSPPGLNLPPKFRVGRPRVNWARDVLGQ
eukprot:11964419-Karenia_brevis.AAC.1